MIHPIDLSQTAQPLQLQGASADTETMPRTVEVPKSMSWEDWYRLARNTLQCRREEAVEYANLRFVEEQNRASLRRANDSVRAKPR
jgi:hypothetical protein